MPTLQVWLTEADFRKLAEAANKTKDQSMARLAADLIRAGIKAAEEDSL
jgi:hypothetical protein